MLERGVWSGFSDQPDDASARATQEMDPQHERLRRAGDGDACAFAELVRDFHAPLCTYVARLVGDDEWG